MADKRIGDRLIPTLVAGFLLAMAALSRGASEQTFELAWALPFGVLFLYLLVGFDWLLALLGILFGLIGALLGIAGNSLSLMRDIPFSPRIVDRQPTVDYTEIYAGERYSNNN